MLPTSRDVIALVPGFLGFERIGGFYYFADRVSVALRSALEARCGPPMPVVPLSTRPTERLQARQEHLLSALNALFARLGGFDRLHLVGHSTGGVDVELLTHEHPLSPRKTWSGLDPLGVRKTIETVVTIASPMWGTALAESPLARFAHDPLGHWQGALQLPGLGWSGLQTLWDDASAFQAWRGFRGDTSQVARFVVDIARSRALIEELTPGGMAALRQSVGEQVLAVGKVRCFVTMAAEKTLGYRGARAEWGAREPDRFFTKLYALTAHRGSEGAEENYARAQVALAGERLRRKIGQGDVIRNPLARLRENVDRHLNDGVVNSVRQIANPEEEDQLADIVVADHVDVIGHYPRWLLQSGLSSLERPVNENSGFLHSGSGFGDDQFFMLMTRIAEEIAPAAARPVVGAASPKEGSVAESSGG